MDTPVDDNAVALPRKRPQPGEMLNPGPHATAGNAGTADDTASRQKRLFLQARYALKRISKMFCSLEQILLMQDIPWDSWLFLPENEPWSLASNALIEKMEEVTPEEENDPCAGYPRVAIDHSLRLFAISCG